MPAPSTCPTCFGDGVDIDKMCETCYGEGAVPLSIRNWKLYMVKRFDDIDDKLVDLKEKVDEIHDIVSGP